jgi:diphthamide biosynthesis protein 2
VDVDKLEAQFGKTFPDREKRFLLMCDTSYAQSLDPIFDRLVSRGYKNITKHLIPDTKHIITPQSTTTTNLLPPMTPIPDTLLLISDPQNSTTTLLTYHHICPEIYTFSPSSCSLASSSPSTNLALRRRYVAVQKARDAGAIGIIVGTLGKGGYLNLITLLRKMILDRGKKPYLLALGKINPAKVANFSECDVFCLIACPESTVVDSRVCLPSN